MAEKATISGHVYFDGSSTPSGFGDWEGGGFVARTQMAYLRYLHLRRQERVRSPCGIVHIKNLSEPDRDTVGLASDLVERMHQFDLPVTRLTTRRFAHRLGREMRELNVLTIGSWPFKWYGQPDDPAYDDAWLRAMYNLEYVHQTLERPTVFINTPRATPNYRRYRTAVQLYERFAPITQRRMDRISDYGDVVYRTFEEIVTEQGDDPAMCMDSDGLHPNARGHARIARFLLPIINQACGIPEGLPEPRIDIPAQYSAQQP